MISYATLSSAFGNSGTALVDVLLAWIESYMIFWWSLWNMLEVVAEVSTGHLVMHLTWFHA